MCKKFFKKFFSEKFPCIVDSILGFGLIYLSYMFCTIMAIALSISVVKIENIYISSIITSCLLTMIISQIVIRLTLKSGAKKEKIERNLTNLYYAVSFTYLFTFVLCSFLAKTTELLSLIFVTMFSIISNFLSPIKFDKEKLIYDLIKNEANDAFIQKKRNISLVLIGTIVLSFHLLCSN